MPPWPTRRTSSYSPQAEFSEGNDSSTGSSSASSRMRANSRSELVEEITNQLLDDVVDRFTRFANRADLVAHGLEHLRPQSRAHLANIVRVRSQSLGQSLVRLLVVVIPHPARTQLLEQGFVLLVRVALAHALDRSVDQRPCEAPVERSIRELVGRRELEVPVSFGCVE